MVMKQTRGVSLAAATEYTPVASSSSSFNEGMNSRRGSYKSPYGRLTAYIPVRYIVLFLVLLATAVEYICRYNINVSMVAMVKPINHTGMENVGVCELPKKSNNSDDSGHVPTGTHDWDSKTQGVILGAFFYTYTLMQIPSGRIAEEFGGRWVVAISLLGSGLLNILTPFLTYSVYIMTISRLILGVLQGGLFPACFAIIFNWFPLKERSVGYAVMEVGTMVGSISASALAGYLAEHGFAGGWPSTFYVSGIIAVISAAVWTPYVTSSPEEHFCVTVGELKTIRHEPTPIATDEEAHQPDHDSSKTRRNRKKSPVPWCAILTNKAVLANVFAKFFLRWTFYTLIMKLPTYLNDMLHMSPTKNGFINATMYVITVGPMLGAGYVSERLIQASIIDRTNCRKLFVSMACIGSAICIGLVPFAGCNETAVICLLLIGNTFGALDSAGNIPNPGELSKHYATTIFAIVNMVNTSAGFIVPYLVGLILTEYKNDPMFAWSVVFYLASGISLIGALIYILFGSAERQSFDFDSKLDHPNDDINIQNDNGDVEELLESEDEPIVNLQEQLLEQHSPVRRLTGASY